MQLSPNITRHSSPGAIGKVSRYPPARGNTTGTSTSKGTSSQVSSPSLYRFSRIASWTETVCVVESKDWMIPGEATRVLIALDLALFSSFTLREGSRSFIGITHYTPIPLFFELASIAGSVPFPYRDIPWQSVYQLVPRVSPE